ncbi:hypothetical protein AN1V17_05480 [Vallitalea sediminicola]
MKKKIVIMLVSILVTLNMIAIPAVAATDSQNYAGDQLHTLGLLKGYTDGTLGLDNNIKRSEVTALLVRALGYSDKEVSGEGKKFSDVESDYWAVPDIQKAYKLKLIVGDTGGTFRPLDNISYAEVVTILVNALGKNADLEGEWPTNYIDRAKEIGIISGENNGDIRRKVTRGEVSVLIWDTILVNLNR